MYSTAVSNSGASRELFLVRLSIRVLVAFAMETRAA